MDILNSDNLIDLHRKLEDFSIHHRNNGGQEAHRLIKEMYDERSSFPGDGSDDGKLIQKGYDKAISDVLILIRSNFIP